MGVRAVDRAAVDASDILESVTARREDTPVLTGKAADLGDIQHGGGMSQRLRHTVNDAGGIAASQAFKNATAGALAPMGIDQLDLPFESERMWRVIQDQEGS